MRLIKDKITFDETILLAGEERLHVMLFGFVEVPDEEWQRRAEFRENLDNMIRRSAVLGRQKWL